ncbi:MAG: DMT family transporter [Alphaproteobacteria bacterium]|nr:MAG: DMT family transporter [Alphaproteobacteria bacterium]
MAAAWMMRREKGAATAIGLILLSSLLYVLGYSLSKHLVVMDGLTPIQVTFLRCSFVLTGSLVAATCPASGVSLRRLLRPARRWEQRAAAASLVASNALAVIAYGLMDVTSASALGFVAPLLLTALGCLILREKVSGLRWFGAGLGFAGVLLVVGPWQGASAIGVVAALAAACAYAVYQVLLRRLRNVATAVDTTMQVGLVGVVLLAGGMLAFWRPLGLAALSLVILFTAIQTAALACLAAALRRGEASRLAPWQFTGLIWAMVLDAVMFSVSPSIVSLLGGLMIVAGGIAAQLEDQPTWLRVRRQ